MKWGREPGCRSAGGYLQESQTRKQYEDGGGGGSSGGGGGNQRRQDRWREGKRDKMRTSEGWLAESELAGQWRGDARRHARNAIRQPRVRRSTHDNALSTAEVPLTLNSRITGFNHRSLWHLVE